VECWLKRTQKVTTENICNYCMPTVISSYDVSEYTRRNVATYRSICMLLHLCQAKYREISFKTAVQIQGSEQ
jgi:hypothetical protein